VHAAIHHVPHGGMTVVRREALRYIPGLTGMDWRDVLGSDVLPGTERLRGQEHDRKTGGRVQVSGTARRGTRAIR
jgi:hypothetical protein